MSHVKFCTKYWHVTSITIIDNVTTDMIYPVRNFPLEDSKELFICFDLCFPWNKIWHPENCFLLDYLFLYIFNLEIGFVFWYCGFDRNRWCGGVTWQWHGGRTPAGEWWLSLWTMWRLSGTVCPAPWQQTSSHTLWSPHHPHSGSSLWSPWAPSEWESVPAHSQMATESSSPQNREDRLGSWKQFSFNNWTQHFCGFSEYF